MASRLNLELERQLKPVRAPEELWSRIQTGPRVRAVRKVRWVLWTSIATAAIALCYVRFGADSTSYVAKMASRELAAGSDQLDFRSSDPDQIRAWVQSHAGIDIPLASGRFVQFIGVALIQGAGCAVCLSYRVGGRKGNLIVARDRSGGPKHSSMRHLSYGGADILAWVAGGQTYAIAGSRENLSVTCTLCHVNRVRSLPDGLG